MSETIKEKREEELVWIWKDKVKLMLQLVKLILTFHSVAHFIIRSHQVISIFLTV